MDLEKPSRMDISTPTLDSTLLTVLCAIISFLLVVTIFFEYLKDSMLEGADKMTLPIVKGLFKELTVLGFLSLVTFVVSKLDVLDKISNAVFGEGKEREQYLEELLETIHMMLFAIMVTLIAQVLALLNISKKQFAKWQKYQRICSSDNANKDEDIAKVISCLEQEIISAETSLLRPFINLISGRFAAYQDLVELLTFDALRDEFVSPRAQFPPFERIKSEILPNNFDMASYMSYQTSSFLVEVIEIPSSTWAAVWAFSLLLLVVMLGSHDDRMILAWIWVVLGWMLMAAHHGVQCSLTWALSQTYNRKYVSRPSLRGWFAENNSEGKALLTGGQQKIRGGNAPGWTYLMLPDPHMRSSLDKCLKGNASRQQLLFPTAAHTRHTNEFLARVFLLSFTIFISILFMQFWPYVSTKETRVSIRITFYVTAVVPGAYYIKSLPIFIKTVVFVNSLRIFKPSEMISTVLRDQKTERAMKAIILLNGMRNQFSFENSADVDNEELLKSVSPHHLQEIGASFDAFDTSGDGNIDKAEFIELMRSLGCCLSHDEADEKLKILDEDNDGTISRNEFICWHIKSQFGKTEEPTIEELVNDLFELFDVSGEDAEASTDGLISVSEFRDGLNRFQAGLNDEEVATLVSELDSDQSGTIDKEEFTSLLLKYAREE